MKCIVSGCLVMAALAAVSVPVCAGHKPSPEQLFKILDTNDDGRLTRAEYVGKARGEDAEKAKDRFFKLDRDASGLLTYEEFEAGIRKKT